MCTRSPLVLDEETSSLYFGAPAVAFAIHAAGRGSDRYAGALQALDTKIVHLTQRRLALAHVRLRCGERPRASEFDLFYGLTGLGCYLLARQHPALQDVLSYLVRLTMPLPHDAEQLPGWWTSPDPFGGGNFPGGHGNLGMAHGIAGPLALLAQSLRRGITVDGQRDAIAVICEWLDTWRQDAEIGRAHV
jgi:membrane-associated phospholipid phosphatase